MPSRMAPLFLSLALLAPSAALAQAVFDAIDTDGDGFVSRAELDKTRLDNFLALDRNGDGVVDRSELMVGPGQGRKGFTAEETQAVLSAYDHDGDGLITRDEVAEAIERLNVFAGLDMNADGKLTREEAAGVLDIRVRGGLAHGQILDDLAQGKRTTAGFRPLKGQVAVDPFDQARIAAAIGNPNGAALPADFESGRQDGWATPSVWNNPDGRGIVTINPNSQTVTSSYGADPLATTTTPYARDGYVARRVDPMRAGSLDPTLPGAVPPGPSGGAPIAVEGRDAGSNWREVQIGPDGRPQD